MSAFTSLRRRLKRALFYPAIKPGQVWEISSQQDNPFSGPDSLGIKIEEVKSDWAKAICTTPKGFNFPIEEPCDRILRTHRLISSPHPEDQDFISP